MRGGLNKMAEMVKRKLARKRGEEVQVMLRVSRESRRRADALRDFAVRVTLRPPTEVDVVRLAIARGLLDIETDRPGWEDAASGDARTDQQIGIRLDPSALERAGALFAGQKGPAYASRSDVLRVAMLVGLSALEREKENGGG